MAQFTAREGGNALIEAVRLFAAAKCVLKGDYEVTAMHDPELTTQVKGLDYSLASVIEDDGPAGRILTDALQWHIVRMTSHLDALIDWTGKALDAAPTLPSRPADLLLGTKQYLMLSKGLVLDSIAGIASVKPSSDELGGISEKIRNLENETNEAQSALSWEAGTGHELLLGLVETLIRYALAISEDIITLTKTDVDG